DGIDAVTSYSTEFSPADRVIVMDYVLGKARVWNRDPEKNARAICWAVSAINTLRQRGREVGEKRQREELVRVGQSGRAAMKTGWCGAYPRERLTVSGERLVVYTGVDQEHHAVDACFSGAGKFFLPSSRALTASGPDTSKGGKR